MEKTGRNPIPASLLEERRNFEIELLKSGLSRATIVKKVNELEPQKNWGTITRRTLQRDISSYYNDQDSYSPGVEVFEARAMREAHIGQLENTIELLRLEIAERDKTQSWNRNERIKAIGILFKIQREYGDIQGFHLLRMSNPYNPYDLSSTQNMHMIYEQAQRDFQEMPKEDQDIFLEALEYVVEKKRTEEEKEERLKLKGKDTADGSVS